MFSGRWYWKFRTKRTIPRHLINHLSLSRIYVSRELDQCVLHSCSVNTLKAKCVHRSIIKNFCANMPVDNKRKVVLKYCDCDDPHGTFKCQEEIRAEKDRNFVKIFLGIFGLGVILICLFIILTVFRLAKLEYQVRNISQSVILMNDATKKFSDSHEFVTYKNVSI